MAKTLLRMLHRYVVTYQDEADERTVKTFAVVCARASIATARTIAYIEKNKLHQGGEGYSLTPRIDNKTKTDFTINETD